MQPFLRIAAMMSLPLAVLPASGCMSLFSCGTPTTLRDCRPFGALQGEDEAPAPEPKKPMIICRDAQRNYSGIEADSCPKGQVKIG